VIWLGTTRGSNGESDLCHSIRHQAYETLGRIAPTIGPGGNIVGEASMEKINYAASSACFVRSDTFITFPEGSGIEALEPGQAFLLPGAIEKIIGLEGAQLTDSEVKVQLSQRQRVEEEAEFDQILSGLALAQNNNNAPVTSLMEKMKAGKLASWLQAGWLTRAAALPSYILDKLQHRHEWAGKFDPFRLVIEHSALAKTKLRGEIVGGRASYVDFTAPDEWLVEPNSPQRGAMVATTHDAMRHLGIARMGLISKFDLCKFSYGYSRVENGPKVKKHDRWMPVRLNLFQKVQVGRDSRHPIYVLEQSNEALYFKLDERLVRTWLAQPALACADAALLADFHGNFAASMLGSAGVMSGYLEEHDRASDPTVYKMTYALLHSYAHYVMQGIQQFSGLDLGSMGEYLFPSDLAFVVYRNGMTLDLGDLSALWRNHHEAFLSYLRNFPSSLGCNLGNLCMTKGGACPDCIMIPEVMFQANDAHCRLLTDEFVVRGYCTKCKAVSNFSLNKRRSSRWQKLNYKKLPVGKFDIVLDCASQREFEDDHSISFWCLQLGSETQSYAVQKIGQYPSFVDVARDEAIEKSKGILPPLDAAEFVTAITEKAHGIGAGSLIYLRRVLERLLRGKFDELKLENGWPDEKFRKNSLPANVELLKDHLPPYLYEINKDIFKALGNGIHRLSEDDCLKHFDPVKEAVMLIFEQDARKRREEENRQAIKSLAP
jgi:hypothetical protein